MGFEGEDNRSPASSGLSSASASDVRFGRSAPSQACTPVRPGVHAKNRHGVPQSGTIHVLHRTDGRVSEQYHQDPWTLGNMVKHPVPAVPGNY